MHFICETSIILLRHTFCLWAVLHHVLCKLNYFVFFFFNVKHLTWLLRCYGPIYNPYGVVTLWTTSIYQLLRINSLRVDSQQLEAYLQSSLHLPSKSLVIVGRESQPHDSAAKVRSGDKPKGSCMGYVWQSCQGKLVAYITQNASKVRVRHSPRTVSEYESQMGISGCS